MAAFTRTFAIIAGILSVPVFGFAVIGGNYSSPFLTHLTDIIQGQKTSVVISSNAPNWSTGTPFPTVIATSVASSSNATAASGLASSTKYYFAVSALDGTGTTTMSNQLSFTTDASTTQPRPEDITIKWVNVTGATGYAVYFSTTTPTLDQYFLATTTGQFTFSTSTGSIAGTYTKDDSTAFSTLINPQGTSYFNGANGTATTTMASSTALEINGALRVQEQSTSTANLTCYSGNFGQIFYNQANGHLWACVATTTGMWTLIK